MKKEAVFVLMLVIMSFHVSAATLHVGSGQTFATIQSAVNAANSGDIIKVHPGTYHETVTVSKNDLTIEGYDPKNPPVLDGADLDFANSAHTWTHVQGSIYRTAYDFPFPHLTPSTFTDAAYTSEATGHRGDPIMTVYEDDIWLRGYEGLMKPALSYPYSSISDLDPSTDDSSDSDREIRIAGRFYYDDAANQLYVWTAKEHGEDSPSNHKYYIPVLKNLIVIKAKDVIVRNIIMKHSYYYAVDVERGGDNAVIENCYVINTGPSAVEVNSAPNVRVLNNFIQIKGFFERQDYISTRYNILKNTMINVYGYNLAKNCEIAGNVITGAYGVIAKGQNCRVHDNIISKSQSILIQPQVESSTTQPAGYDQNVSIYHNILHHADFSAFTSYNTFSSDLNVYYGPIYFYRNVMYAIPQINKDGCQDTPCDSTPDVFIYQNTFVFAKSIVHHPYAYPVRKSTVYRNNIVQFREGCMEMYWIYTSKDPAKGWSYFPFTAGPDSDYNIYLRQSQCGWSQIARFRLTNDPELQSYSEGQFSLMQTQTGFDTHSREADPDFVHGSEFATANPFNIDYDIFSTMDYRDVINQGYMNLYNQYFSSLYHYFDVQPSSPAIDKGEKLPSSWPDTVTITDGKPDIGAVEYGASPCTVHWTCTDWSGWSNCVNNAQTRTRTCTDSNNCGTTSGKPQVTDSQSCSMAPALVSRWDFEKGSGATVEDSVGNNDGTISGATWTTGSRTGGHALDFDGVDDHVHIADDASLDPSYATVSLWFRPDSLPDNTGLIAKGDNSNRQYWIWIYDGNISLEIDNGGHYNNIYSLQLGAWYNLAVTYDGSDIITYINGNEVDRKPQETGPLLMSDGPFYIGKLPGYTSFDGTIDDVRLYNYALSQSDIKEIFDSAGSMCGKADINTDGSVTISELIGFISRWKSGNTTIDELISAISKWRGGC